MNLQLNDLTLQQGNFEFVRLLYPDIYKILHEAECTAYSDVRGSGNKFRESFEGLLTKLLHDYQITARPSGPGGHISLNDKRSALRNEKKLPQLPRSSYTYTTLNGSSKDGEGYYLWQHLGNACSHNPNDPVHGDPGKEPAVTFRNLVTVMQIIHAAFLQEYRRKKGDKSAAAVAPFNETIIPFGSNYVLREYTPDDSILSNCIHEFETLSLNEMGRPEKYGIVRVFKKEKLNRQMMILRDREAFAEAEAEAGIQFDGNVQIEVFSRMDSNSSDFYIVIYKFINRPKRLTDILPSLSLEQRLDMCRKVSRILLQFHSLSTPIYHRNLSYDSIYVSSRGNDSLVPTVIKLECAKIDSTEFGTVIASVKSRQHLMRQQKLLKYSSPEIQRISSGNGQNIDWAKADIFSLGVLFADLIMGKIRGQMPTVMDYTLAKVNRDMIALIKEMTAPRPEMRPTLCDVISRLDTIDAE